MARLVDYKCRIIAPTDPRSQFSKSKGIEFYVGLYRPKSHDLGSQIESKVPLNLPEGTCADALNLLFPIATTYWEVFKKHGSATPVVNLINLSTVTCMQADVVASFRDSFLPYEVLEAAHQQLSPFAKPRDIRGNFRDTMGSIKNYNHLVVKGKGYAIRQQD